MISGSGILEHKATGTTQVRSTIQAAVVGVSGYSGAELARLLLGHPRLSSTAPVFFGRSDAGSTIASLQPQLRSFHGAENNLVQPFSLQAVKDSGAEVVFLATPHEQSREWVPEALALGLKVIDLSGAWRLKQASNRAVYKLTDADPAVAAQLDEEAVYGMPELHREEIRSARLIANPGCYATSIILALKPLVAAGLVNTERGIVSDAKSGVSGAGKAPTAKTHFMHAADNLSAYGLFGHRHMGELLEQLEIHQDTIMFTPHLLPIPRGILATSYVHFHTPQTVESIDGTYKQFFAGSPMVRLYGSAMPEIQHSVRTAFCDIGFQLSSDGRRGIVVSCLDNLLKGAASQAVQNLNLMCGWHEAEGLL